jgi:hypothetical protein
MQNLLTVNEVAMKELNLIEQTQISGGTTDVGNWLVDKIGDAVCWVRSSLRKLDFSGLKNYSHGTYPSSLK